MSDINSAIFVPSCLPSPSQESAGNTPYVVTSPPPDSPTDSEAAWPHQMMLEHVLTILGVEVEELHHQFPNNRSLLPIDVPPPRALTPSFVPPAPSPPFLPGSPARLYPGSELAEYNDPDFPSEPPSTSLSPSIELPTILHRSSPRIPLDDITPIRQVSHPLGDTTDYEELAMVLY